MTTLRPVIWVTFLEGMRSKTVYGISLLAGLMMAFTVVISGMIMRDVGKVATDFALSSATFAALLVVLFVGITMLAKDLERKTIYLALSRAVPRSGYLLGRYLGLALVLTVTVAYLCLASLATLLLVKSMYPGYFGTVSLGLVALAHLFILVQMSLLVALSMLFSMIASSSFVAFMLTIITYLIGSSTYEVKRLLESADSVQVAPVTKLVVKLAYYIFPNLSLFDLKNVAAHGLPISFAKLGFALGYSICYAVAVLVLAVILFQRKELN